MNYYTLTTRGKAWVDDDAPDPLKHKNVLASLAELIEENDVPRATVQIARNINLEEDQTEQSLKYLIRAGYAKRTALPRPSEKEQTPKLRVRPIEELVAAEMRTIESQQRYTRSPKGKFVHSKYEESEKGKAKNVRYRESGKGKLVHKAYRMRRRLRELTNFLVANPEKESEIRPLIIDVEARLTTLKEENND